MKSLIRKMSFAICTLLTCVFTACNISYKNELDDKFNDAVNNQIRCNEPFINAIHNRDLEKAELYLDSIRYYANIVDSIHGLMHPENAR